MMTTLAVFVMALSPILITVILLEAATWAQRRRAQNVAWQIALTDAIAGELGAVVAPVVTKPVFRPRQIRIAVPFGCPQTVATVLAIAHRVLAFGERMLSGRYEIVLTPQEEPIPVPTRAPVKTNVVPVPRAKAA